MSFPGLPSVMLRPAPPIGRCGELVHHREQCLALARAAPARLGEHRALRSALVPKRQLACTGGSSRQRRNVAEECEG